MGGSLVDDFCTQFRQFLYLDRKRAAERLSPSELRRWLKLKRILNQEFSPNTSYERAERRESVRVPVRLRISFTDLGELRGSLMTNLSRGGVFIATDRPAEIGTRLELRIHIEDTGEEIDVPGQVVSQNVGPNFESGQCGMGLRFLEMKPEVGRKVEALYERKLKEAAERKR
jgi:uncharacterized protein (TIGR02266 family)